MQQKRLLLSQTAAWWKEFVLRYCCPAAARGRHGGRQPSFMLNCQIFLLFRLTVVGFPSRCLVPVTALPGAVPSIAPHAAAQSFYVD